MPTIRVAEVLAALSLTTDLASGAPFEKGLATCAVSTAFAQVLGLDTADRHAVFHTALLRAVGPTAYASRVRGEPGARAAARLPGAAADMLGVLVRMGAVPPPA